MTKNQAKALSAAQREAEQREAVEAEKLQRALRLAMYARRTA